MKYYRDRIGQYWTITEYGTRYRIYPHWLRRVVIRFSTWLRGAP